jgi:hypothetical protein
MRTHPMSHIDLDLLMFGDGQTVKKLQKLATSGGLILAGVTLGLWIGRPHKSSVDLGAAPSQFVPSGVLKLVDSSGTELATVGVDLGLPSMGQSLGIELSNGVDGHLGEYLSSSGGLFQSLRVSAPHKDTADNEGWVGFTLNGLVHRDLKSKSPISSNEVFVPVEDAYKPRRFSEEWWLQLLFSGEKPETLESKIPSEDSRMVRRDGKPFAVCGHDSYGNPAIVFVDGEYVPEARMYFESLQGNIVFPTFEIFDRMGHSAALLSTNALRGPQLSFASADPSSNTGETLFDLDPTGTKLLQFKLGPNAGVVDWLAQPMYRARLPIRLVDATGKVIWSTNKAAP